MKTFYVSVVVHKPIATGFNMQNKVYTVDAVSEDEARGKVLVLSQEDFPGYTLNTILPFEKEDAGKNVWQQVVDEALVVAHIGIANNDATFDEAKKKLNDLICHSIDIDRYFLEEEKKQQAQQKCPIEPVQDEACSLCMAGEGKCLAAQAQQPATQEEKYLVGLTVQDAGGNTTINWHGKHPYSFPVGTKFFALPPAQEGDKEWN